jgi:hypothetical protein
MSGYIGCEYARARLEAYVDEELSVEEQIDVETHVRWCDTCAARIEDLRLIGCSIRVAAPGPRAAEELEREVNTLSSDAAMHVRAERDESLGVRLPALMSDRHLLWPALGATLAVIVCATLAFGVLRRASVGLPESLASKLDAMTSPGSELNPLMPDSLARVDPYFAKYVDSDRAGGISLPRALDGSRGFETLPGHEATFTMATVVSRDGRIANVELLSFERGARTEPRGHANDVEALVFDAVRQSRFAPAQTPVGRAVAVNMVWLIVMTTVQTDAPGGARVSQVAPLVDRVEPVAPEVALPPVRQSSTRSLSPTA